MTRGAGKTEPKCEGACDNYVGHRAEIFRVRITGYGQDWGEFNYCEEAIKEDRRRGFNVQVTQTPEGADKS